MAHGARKSNQTSDATLLRKSVETRSIWHDSTKWLRGPLEALPWHRTVVASEWSRQRHLATAASYLSTEAKHVGEGPGNSCPKLPAYATRSARFVYLEVARLMSTLAPCRTARNSVASPTTCPKIFTGLYARGRSPLLTGVGPKNMQKACPTGQ